MRTLVPLLFLPISFTGLSSTSAAAPPVQVELQEVTRAPQVPLAVRVRSLLQQYEFAMQRWREELDAADESSRQTVLAANPTAGFVESFEGFAEEGSLEAKLFVLEHYDALGRSAEETRERRVALVEDVCLNHPHEAPTSKLSEIMRDLWEECDRDRLASSLLGLVYQTRNRTTRREVGEELATCLAFAPRDDDDVASAKALFEELLTDEPADGFRQRVRGKLYRMENLVVGKAAPELTGKGADGNELRLSDHRGKVVVLDFWGFWCGSCREELPHLKALAARHPDDLVVFGVNAGDSPDVFRTQARLNEIAWPNIVLGDDFSLPIDLGIDMYPTTFVLDRTGTIRAVDPGDDLDRLVAELVATTE